MKVIQFACLEGKLSCLNVVIVLILINGNSISSVQTPETLFLYPSLSFSVFPRH